MKLKLVNPEKLCERYKQFEGSKAGMIFNDLGAYMDGSVDIETSNGVANVSGQYVGMCFTRVKDR